MFAVVAALVALVATDAPVAAPATAPVPVTRVAAADVAIPSALPGTPRAVTVETTAHGRIVSWQPPTTSGASPLSGYVVIVGETASYVAADTTRMVLAGSASRVAVASMNGAGCSVATEASLLVASRLPR